MLRTGVVLWLSKLNIITNKCNISLQAYDSLTIETPLEHLGIIITKLHDGTITLSQKHYIEKEIIEVYKPKKLYKTPAINSESEEDGDKLIDKNHYLQKLMKLY